jgi:hypothetical protein
MEEGENIIKVSTPISAIPYQLQNSNFRFVLLGKWNVWGRFENKNGKKVCVEKKIFSSEDYDTINKELWKPFGKSPYENGWQNKEYFFDDMRILRHTGNLGVIGGKGRLRILDIDNIELSEEIAKKINTFTTKTGSQGRHFYFTSDYSINHVLINQLGELRCNNYQVVIAGSHHPNGNFYVVENDTEIKEISEMDLTELIKPFLREDNPVNPNPTQLRLVNKDTSRSGEEYRKVLSYIVDGNSKETIFSLMNNPLYTKWNSAGVDYQERTYQRAFDYWHGLDEEGRAKFFERNKKNTVFEELEQENYSPCTAKDFLSVPDKKEKPIINPLVLEESIITFFGLPGSLKSILAVYLSVCISTGGKFLNRYKCRKQNVLYLSTENSERLDRKRLRAICRGLKIVPAKRSLDNFRFFYVPRKKISVLNDSKYYNALLEIIRDKKIKVLVIDTLSPMILDTKDGAEEVVKTYNTKLFPLIDEFGLSIILIMHSQKTGFDFLGSVKHKASADLFYKVERDDETNLVTLGCHKGREGETNISFKVIFSSKTKLSSKLSCDFEFVKEWQGRQTPKKKEDNTKKEDNVKEYVLEILKNAELSYTEMTEKCISNGFSPATTHRAINSLYESQIIAKQPGKRGGYHIK